MQENKEIKEEIPVEVKELVKTEGGSIEKAEGMLEQLERRNLLLDRAMAMSIGKTNKRDWVSMGGKPYLQIGGSVKVARLWGIGISNVINSGKIEEKDEKGSYYRYKFTADFQIPGELPQEGHGACTSRDKFFGQLSEKKDKQTGEILQKKGFKESWEIDENNIEKKAYTNCLNNGIKQVTGLRDATWDEIALYAKGSGEVGKVEYQKGKQAKEGDKKSSGDMLAQMDKWVDNIAYFHIKQNDEGVMEVVEVKNEKVKLERKIEYHQKWTTFKDFTGYKNTDEIKAAWEKNTKRVFPMYKSYEGRYSKFKTDAEQLGVEGL